MSNPVTMNQCRCRAVSVLRVLERGNTPKLVNPKRPFHPTGALCDHRAEIDTVAAGLNALGAHLWECHTAKTTCGRAKANANIPFPTSVRVTAIVSFFGAGRFLRACNGVLRPERRDRKYRDERNTYSPRHLSSCD